MTFDQKDFNNFILSNDVVKIGKETPLSSGGNSSFFIDWKEVFGDAYLLDQLTKYVIDFLKDHKLDKECFYGIPEGCTPLATNVTLTLARKSPDYKPGSHPIAVGRKFRKKAGLLERRDFVTPPSDKVTILEDTVTTGANLLEHIKRIFDANKIIYGAIALTDRLQNVGDKNHKYSVKDILSQMDVPFYSMSNAIDLLPLAIKKYKPDEKVIRSIEQECERNGLEPIVLR